jgi:hydrogenase maturation protein HypF
VTTAVPAAERAARLLRITGVVQGVGFRPYVHRLAARHSLAGWVRNGSGDVQVEVEGALEAIDAFLEALGREAPPHAHVERVDAIPVVVQGREGFTILDSSDEPDRRQPVSPDVAICPACEAELFEPGNRRHRYPFITCTDCGPRFTVIEAMPYDRARTSMRAFAQCPECLAEYRSPGDRRFHSETNSCPRCGPRLWFVAGGNRPTPFEGESALEAAAALLRRGGILALRGLGGFHLAADAGDEVAVQRLRDRKQREAKPLAIMVRTLEEACAIARVSPHEAGVLRSAERPIVLLGRQSGAPLAEALAPGLDQIGLMLAYTPLHHLLLDLVRRPLVMTSGNRSDEPIAIGNDEALARLDGIADGFLLHDREILSRYDDSVIRLVEGTPVLLRRARGYAPLPLDLPCESPRPLIAVGPHLKNTFTLVHGRRAFVSQHIGDLESLETLEHFQSSLALYQRLFRVRPEVAVRDRHPGYLSTRVAEELGLERTIAVQHHHAHVAAVLAEHGETGPVVGIAYDGTGYGDDGHVWGSEILVADLLGYRRVAHLRYAPLPGGDAAARAPWRSALGYLSLEKMAAQAFALAFEGIPHRDRSLAERQTAARLNCPLASSMGRLFDAAAAVLGVRRVSRYEGQAAMELEALAGRRVASEYRCRLEEEDGVWTVDPLPLLVELGIRRQRGEDVCGLAADFHASIAWATTLLTLRACERAGVSTAVLSGGTFQNARLLGSMVRRLTEAGIRVLTPRLLGPNDGAISLGQAAVAAATLRHERSV